MENTFGNFLHNNQNAHRNADTRFENADRNINRQSDNRDTHNHTPENGADNNRTRSGQNFEQVLERNFREAFEAEFRQKQRGDAFGFIKKHWFKLGLLVALLFFIVKKDWAKFDGIEGKSSEKTEKQGSKLTIAPNKSVEEVPLSIGGGLTGESNKTTAEMPTIDEEVKKAYLRRFAQVAVSERRKYGIPSSVILANALRQSFAGQRNTTVKLNNHFNLPCTFDWSSKSEKIDGECFRQYENAWVSFRDHSVFVTSGKFSVLRKLSDKDYKAWALGLQRLGYPASNDNLASELIGIIEQYELQVLDTVK